MRPWMLYVPEVFQPSSLWLVRRVHVTSAFLGVRAVDALVPSILLGTALVVLFLVVTSVGAFKLWKSFTAAHTVQFILLAYSVLFAVVTAYGRICIGLSAAIASRYMTYCILGYFGLYIAARSVEFRPQRTFWLSAILLIAFIASRHSAHDRAQLAELRDQRSAWKACYLAKGAAAQCAEATHFVVYWPGQNGEIEPKLQFLREHHLNLFLSP